MIKKILLTTAAAAVFASSAACAAEGDFYVKAHAGGAKHAKISGLKSNAGAFLSVGAGYSVMDNVRVEGVFTHAFDPSFKGTTTVKDDGAAAVAAVAAVGGVAAVPAVDAIAPKDVKRTAKIKTKVNTFLVNAFVDVADVSVAKFFVGAGAGLARVEGTETWSLADGALKKDGITKGTTKAKAKHVFAAAAYVGASVEMAPGIHGEAMYSFRHHGKGKAPLKAISGHYGSAGVRFDI